MSAYKNIFSHYLLLKIYYNLKYKIDIIYIKI